MEQGACRMAVHHKVSPDRVRGESLGGVGLVKSNIKTVFERKRSYGREVKWIGSRGS